MNINIPFAGRVQLEREAERARVQPVHCIAVYRALSLSGMNIVKVVALSMDGPFRTD